MDKQYTMIDGNEAAAYVAHRTNEVIAIYPITPSSNMGEWADQWSAMNIPNIWGVVPVVREMQSEAGASGAVHGSLQTGALTTTFTASQGLLLMIPNMYKIAGELTPAVIHVSARTVATHALSIFGDHSDVMSTRQTGFALLSSNSVQEVMDMGLIAQAATLKSRIPFLHFFDGFRTSHEVAKIERLTDEQIRAMIDDDLVRAHRDRALSPDHPVIRGTAQNPDVFFQHREACNPFYAACPGIVEETMARFGELTGRQYSLFDYHGAPDAERIIVLMGSGVEAAHETVDYMVDKGEKVGIVKVRLYRPFSVEHFVAALPKTTRSIAVLDRTKEPGAPGEPLFMDAVNALFEKAPSGRFDAFPRLIGGRYGLSSKEFTPAMVKRVFDELQSEKPKNHFTVGIRDDVTGASLTHDPEFSTEPDDVVRAVFYGLGSDGTVSAAKNSVTIIGEFTENYAQGYFVYDSKKAGAVTVSHLRFGPRPIRSTYLVDRADFVGCNQFSFLERIEVLKSAKPGSIFLLNAPYGPEEVWDRIPRAVQQEIINKKMSFYVIDAYKLGKELGLGARINTIMQACFFSISGILPKEEAIDAIKKSIKKSYGKKGDLIVQKNFDAVDAAVANLHQVAVPAEVTSELEMWSPITSESSDFFNKVTALMIAGRGDDLPVSACPVDGTYPVGTAKFEKRNITQEIPVWDEDICIQCGKCAMVCPHSVIRIKVYDKSYLDDAPPTFKSMDGKDKDWKGLKYTIQMAPEDCTGCAICVDVCPVKNKEETRFKAINMAPQAPLRESEKENWDYFNTIPEFDRNKVRQNVIKHSQILEPLFEFSGACAGCGETPYIKLMTQLFGDRALIANATGCSSIYGGNLPTAPWTTDKNGRGPTWCNSLFEDNAEFGFGYRLSINKQRDLARTLLKKFESKLGTELVEEILQAEQKEEPDIFEQRERVEIVKEELKDIDNDEARQLLSVADKLVKKSVWVVGGDGWAYDIGFGGLDHVLASGEDVNILVLDTEVYSNTGGQMSKSTPRAAVAKFAAAGKPLPKKDLARIAMTYGNVYVASVAMGAKDQHTLRAFLEAEAYEGPSLIIAYSHCIAHGINMTTGLQNQKAAVATGYWPLFRYNPDLAAEGKNPLQLDSRAPSVPLKDYVYRENRFKILTKSRPREAAVLLEQAQKDIHDRWRAYKAMASIWSE